MARAMPQAIERSLATPMTRPRLPAMSVPVGASASGASDMDIWDQWLQWGFGGGTPPPAGQGVAAASSRRRPSPSGISAMDSSAADPIARFEAWLAEATRSEPNDPNAVCLATSTPD